MVRIMAGWALQAYQEVFITSRCQQILSYLNLFDQRNYNQLNYSKQYYYSFYYGSCT